MRLLGATVFALAAQLVLGWVMCGGVAFALSRTGRRQMSNWTRARRELARCVPWSLALLIALFLIDPPTMPHRAFGIGFWALPWPLLAATSWSTSGCYLALHAGLLEGAGQIRTSRRQARLAGLFMFAGTLVFLALVGGELLFHVSWRTAVFASSEALTQLAVGVAGIGLAGFIGLLAGLAAKPRPSSWFAALLLILGMLGLVGAPLSV